MKHIDNYTLEELQQMYAPYVEAAKSISRTSHHGVYLADIQRQKLIFFSEHDLVKGGMELDKIYEKGLEYLADFTYADDKKVLEQGFRNLLPFYKQIKPEDRERFVVILNFRIKIGKKSCKLYHKITPLAFNDSGIPELALGVVSISSNKQTSGIYAGIAGTTQFFSFLSEDMHWKTFEPVQLLDGEKEMLRLSMLGYTLNDIAEEMHLSIETVKKYRQQVNNKFGVKNIPEAVAYTIGCYIEYADIYY